MLPELIGITGFKRSGKDTVAQILVELEGYVRLAFADALKQEVAAFLGISLDELERGKETWRSVLQLHGCAARAVDSYHWIKLVEDKWYANCPKRAVISDVRFENEAEWVHLLGGTILRTVRDGIVAADPVWHESERRVANIRADYTIDASSVEGLQARTAAWIESMVRDDV